jgi:hypothetical protein
MGDISGSHTITTSATSQQIMSNRNGKRIAFSISNYGATAAWINISNEEGATVGYGIYLPPGTTVSDSNNGSGYKCSQSTISVVDDGAGGATTLSYWERVEV